MKRILSYLLITAVTSMALDSCLYQEEDFFDKSSSQRMAETLVDIQKVLTGASQGWVMYYYPNGGASYSAGAQGIGGYVLTMTFTDTQVTAWNEKLTGSATSIYRMTDDDGPTLSFDTFNRNLHYFATPSGSGKNLYGETGNYQAYKGDFEFLVLKHEPDEIILKGKRSRNYYKMYPLTTSPESYVAETVQMGKLVFMSTFDGNFKGQPANLTLDLKARQATITLNGDTENAKSVAYNFTPEGIRFYKDLTIGEQTFTAFKFDRDKATLTSVEFPDMVLQGTLPEGWSSYSSFLGKWTFHYDGDKTIADVQIKQDAEGESYKIAGLGDLFELAAEYDLSTGTLSIHTQYVGQDSETGYHIYMRPISKTSGYAAYVQTYGFTGTLSKVNGVDTITLVDNGKWTRKTDTFRLYYSTQISYASTYIVSVTSAPWVWKNGSEELSYWTSFVRQ